MDPFMKSYAGSKQNPDVPLDETPFCEKNWVGPEPDTMLESIRFLIWFRESAA
jgi:hypothetical protein